MTRKLNTLNQYSIAANRDVRTTGKNLIRSTNRSLLVYTSTTRNPERNRVIVLLSIKAGLRGGEIAKLTWDMVLDPTGEVESVIELRDRVAKKNSGRLIPRSVDLAQSKRGRCGHSV
jgi:integrase